MHRPNTFAIWTLTATLAVIGFAQGNEAERSAARTIADATLAGTVGIRCEGADAFINHSGTGIVVSPSGHVLTATSVVPPGARKIRVTFPGFVVRDATIVAVDEKLAAALIKVDAEGSLPFLPVARELPAVGTTAYTASDVENALLTNGRASFSRGIVSGIYDVPKHPEATYAGTAIETTAAVNPGSDGGPLVDEAGRVCGVITLGTLPGHGGADDGVGGAVRALRSGRDPPAGRRGHARRDASSADRGGRDRPVPGGRRGGTAIPGRDPAADVVGGVSGGHQGFRQAW
jgi:S1-C subfamily serine protease